MKSAVCKAGGIFRSSFAEASFPINTDTNTAGCAFAQLNVSINLAIPAKETRHSFLRGGCREKICLTGDIIHNSGVANVRQQNYNQPNFIIPEEPIKTKAILLKTQSGQSIKYFLKGDNDKLASLKISS